MSRRLTFVPRFSPGRGDPSRCFRHRSRPRRTQKDRKHRPRFPGSCKPLPFSHGDALARCIVGAVVRPEPVLTTSPVTPLLLLRLGSGPQAPRRPQQGLRGRARHSGSCLFPEHKRRKPEERGEELREARGERPPYVLVRLATAAREPGVPAASSSSGGGGGTRRGRREPAEAAAAAAAAAPATWRRRWRIPGG